MSPSHSLRLQFVIWVWNYYDGFSDTWELPRVCGHRTGNARRMFFAHWSEKTPGRATIRRARGTAPHRHEALQHQDAWVVQGALESAVPLFLKQALGQQCVCVCVCVCVRVISHVWLCVTPQTVAHQAPLSTGFSRQEYWSGLPCPSPGDLPDPVIKPASLASPALAGGFFTTVATGKTLGIAAVCTFSTKQLKRKDDKCNFFLLSEVMWVYVGRQRDNQQNSRQLAGIRDTQQQGAAHTTSPQGESNLPPPPHWYTMEYYSAIQRNGFESAELRWMNLEPIIQSEVNQKEKSK